MPAACAACLDPETSISGYKLPLETEVRSAQVLIIGRVLSEQRLPGTHPVRSRTNRETWIDSCGNSDVLPRGEHVVKAIRTQLRASK
jgi:hypothetical protein